MQKLTKAEKEKRGTLRKCREVDTPLTFNPVEGIDVPDYLSGYAIEFFEHYSGILASARILTAADYMELEMASVAYNEFRKAVDVMDETGSIQTTSTGYKQKSAAWTVFADARKILSEFGNKYGLNVLARERIKADPPPEEDDLDKIINKKK